MKTLCIYFVILSVFATFAGSMLVAHCCACVFVNSFPKLALPSAVT